MDTAQLSESFTRLDWIVVGLFFASMVVIGIWAMFRNRDTEDYFVGGGKIPWWLSGISHHVSGYSGVVFVAYAGLAYTHGLSIYSWWAVPVALGVILTARIFPARWVRLRQHFNIQSPLEYLSVRYGKGTRQLMAWTGVLLKLFDVGAKWAAIAVLLQAFAGVPISTGILISGGVSLVYVALGGLWAVLLTDFAQFVVQLVGGIVMFVAVVMELGGLGAATEMWSQLPERNGQWFNEDYTIWFALAFLFVGTLSYNGGTWNLATRYISSASEQDASRAARLSGALYLVWPLILFFPMWAAPILLPGLANPEESYGLLTVKLLPAGLVGLVLASLFANTMSMTSSDANTISAVIARDILPDVSRRLRDLAQRRALLVARITTVVFTVLTIVVALNYERFGGIVSLIIFWYGALVGPLAIPMLLGLLPWFRHCDARAAIVSIVAGLAAFVVSKFWLVTPEGEALSKALSVSLPLIVSTLVYSAMGWLNRKTPVPEEVEQMLASIRPK
jgi:SSS family transporter